MFFIGYENYYFSAFFFGFYRMAAISPSIAPAFRRPCRYQKKAARLRTAFFIMAFIRFRG